MNPNLTLKKSDLYVSVSRNRGWGEGPDIGGKAWNPRQMGVLKDCVDSGCRRFYWPPPAATGGSESYQWSFLTPVGQVTIDADAEGAFFPDDFGGLLSKLTISQDAAIFVPIPVVNEARIREMFASNPSTTGRPLYAAELALKGTTHDHGPRKKLLVYPRPDQEYTFRFQYALLPGCLTDSYPFAYGGQEHSETILQSCLRISEERYDNVKDGPHAQAYFECLAGSISRDRAHKPHLIGYNADQSDAFETSQWFADYWQPVTLNGLPMGSY